MLCTCEYGKCAVASSWQQLLPVDSKLSVSPPVLTCFGIFFRSKIIPELTITSVLVLTQIHKSHSRTITRKMPRTKTKIVVCMNGALGLRWQGEYSEEKSPSLPPGLPQMAPVPACRSPLCCTGQLMGFKIILNNAFSVCCPSVHKLLSSRSGFCCCKYCGQALARK